MTYSNEKKNNNNYNDTKIASCVFVYVYKNRAQYYTQ